MRMVRINTGSGDFHALVSDTVLADDYFEADDYLSMTSIDSLGDELEGALGDSEGFLSQLSEVALFWRRNR
jgi:hypothetical protein